MCTMLNTCTGIISFFEFGTCAKNYYENNKFQFLGNNSPIVCSLMQKKSYICSSRALWTEWLKTHL